MATSKADGSFILMVPERRQSFGVLSPRYGVLGLRRTAPLEVTVIVGALPPPARARRSVDRRGSLAATLAPGLIVNVDGQASVLRGKVVDETGAPLPGVRVDALDDAGKATSSAFSDGAGRFTLPAARGKKRLKPVATGLRLRSGVSSRGGVTLVMEIDAEPETVVVREGFRLTFNIFDSVDPPYYPPPQVRLFLCWRYGIRVSHDPPSHTQRAGLKPFWWLDVLRSEPEHNPGQIDTPPSGVPVPEAVRAVMNRSCIDTDPRVDPSRYSPDPLRRIQPDDRGSGPLKP